MLFKEIIEGRYRVFGRMKDDERARNIGVVKYIENLASMAGVNIQEWNAKDIFGQSGNKLIDDKNDINRRFFEEVDRIAAATPIVEGADTFTEAMKQAVRAAESRHVTNLVAREQSEADARLREAMARYRTYEELLKKAGEHSATVRRLMNQATNIEEQVRQVSSGNFWLFTGLDGGTKLEFATRADIVLTHRNPAAGIDININFGRFKAVFNITDFSLRVFGIERNISVGGYPHPHIQSSGSICWGSASTTATRLLASCSFVEPMTLLATVLSSYNSGSPYVSMERFQEHIGLPEEVHARDEMNTTRDQVRSRYTLVDAGTIDVDRRREPAPILTPENNPVPAIDAGAIPANPPAVSVTNGATPPVRTINVNF